MNIAPVRWKDGTHRQKFCSPLFRLCPAFLPLPCCQAMSVKAVHVMNIYPLPVGPNLNDHFSVYVANMTP